MPSRFATAVSCTYDPASQVTAISHQLTALSQQINKAEYSYNPVGNRTQLTDRRGSQAFGYDPLDRLTSASHPLLATPQAFAYNPVGNRTTGGSVVNAGNQLTADATYTYQYDDNGNLTRKTLLASGNYSQYTYHAENRLTKVEEFAAGASIPAATSTYRYDGLGRRIEKVANGQTKRYIYDGEDILVEYDGANVLQARNSNGVRSCLVHGECGSLSGMARPLRLEYAGALYHVTARGNARQDIFLDDDDRQRFLGVLDRVVSRFHLLLHAYCLMDNHFHLVVETPEANLSKAMRQLNGVYTQVFNRRHRRVGHVLQGRFKAIVVEREGYLLELCRYVVLNPVRAGLIRQPDTYPWSSYRATAGLASAPACLTVDWLLSQFGRQRSAAQTKYRAFVAEGIGQESPWEQVQGQVLLGSDRFVEQLRPGLQEKRPMKEIPRQQRFADRPTLRQLFPVRFRANRTQRNETIRRAHVEHGYSLSDIGRVLDLHYSTISRLVSAQERPNAPHKI